MSLKHKYTSILWEYKGVANRVPLEAAYTMEISTQHIYSRGIWEFTPVEVQEQTQDQAEVPELQCIPSPYETLELQRSFRAGVKGTVFRFPRWPVFWFRLPLKRSMNLDKKFFKLTQSLSECWKLTDILTRCSYKMGEYFSILDWRPVHQRREGVSVLWLGKRYWKSLPRRGDIWILS